MRKLAFAAFSFSAAIFIAHYALPHNLLLYFAAAAFFSAFGALLLKNTLHKTAALIITLSLTAGFLWSFIYTALIVHPAVRLDGETKTVSAVVCDYPTPTQRGSSVSVKIRTGSGGSVKAVLYYYDDTDLKPGDAVDFTASFKRTDKTDNGGGFDALTSRGFFITAYTVSDITVIGTDGPFRYFPVKISGALAEMIDKLFNDDVSPFMRALLTGRRDRLNSDTELNAALGISGISHVVAVSGMHVTFVTGFFKVFIRRKRLFACVVLPTLFVFMAMTGFTPSVSRAGIMQICMLTAPLFKRENDGITSLSLAALVQLAANPYASRSIGLQLSFAAVLGVLLMTGRIYDSIYDRFRETKPLERKFIRSAVTFVISSISSTIGALVLTIPLTVLYFGYASLAAPLTNLLTLWAVAAAFSGGFIACILGFIFLPLGTAASFIVTPFAGYIIKTAQIIAKIPNAALYISNRLILFWLVYVYLMLIVLFVLRVKRLRCFLYPSCFAVVSLCVILLFTPASSGSGSMRVTALDIGQGQSIVISSGGYTAMVDCGGDRSNDTGSAAVSFLAKNGITSVDLLILTHFHTDHVNGVEYLLSRTDIKTLAIPDPEDSYLAEDIIALARKRGTDIIYVTETMTASLGDMEFTLFPPFTPPSGAYDENERCLAVLCTDGVFSALVTGDMDKNGELRLMRNAQLPDIDLLIVGHHGSRYSSAPEFLDTVTPEVALISVGRDNTYGHPAPETLQALALRGIAVYRTDLDGDITTYFSPKEK